MIPACISFGPLFMTRIAGSASTEYGGDLVFTGVVMLSVGLIGMYRIIAKQQKTIRELEARLRKEVGALRDPGL